MANEKQDIEVTPLSEIEPDLKNEAENSADRQAEGSMTERGGPKGPEPTRFGDWENNGRCADF